MASKSKIKSDTKLIQFCIDILRGYLQEESKFVADINSSKERSYHLRAVSDYGLTRLNAHGISVPVVRLDNEFFLACSISFKPIGQKMEFKGISLQFFDVEKLLFRAEWDNWKIKKEESNTDEDLKQHPQPHWHLGDSKGAGITENVASSFEAYVRQSSYSQFEQQMKERDKRDLNRLHFFMMLEYGKYACYDLTYEEDFKFWLSKTIKSVNRELSYLSK